MGGNVTRARNRRRKVLERAKLGLCFKCDNKALPKRKLCAEHHRLQYIQHRKYYEKRLRQQQ